MPSLALSEPYCLTTSHFHPEISQELNLTMSKMEFTFSSFLFQMDLVSLSSLLSITFHSYLHYAIATISVDPFQHTMNF